MGSFAQEGHSGLLKVAPFLSKDGPMAPVGKYPELRLRYRSRHFNGQFDGIERIVVALHDQRSSLDRREIRRSEVHIVITGSKQFRAFEESPNLRITTRMMAAKKFPLLLGKAVRILTHDRTRLWWKVRRRTDQNHGFDAFWLPGGQVQEDVAAATDADSFTNADSQVVEQRDYVGRRILMAERLRQNAGAAMSAQVRQFDLEVWPHPGAEGSQSWLEPEKPWSNNSASPLPWVSK